MTTEQDIIKRLVEEKEGIEWVVARKRDNVEAMAEQPTQDVFWKELVLALLTSQQRSTEGSTTDLFGLEKPFRLSLQTYKAMEDDDEVREILKSFRFGKPVTRYLRVNYDRLFGQAGVWAIVEPRLQQLLVQRNSPADASHKDLEREVAHLLASHLMGIGPKQSRNLLQELGLTRYEIPLDSRVAGWLEENLGWYISRDSLSNDADYEFWLDRLQSVCTAAGVLPTIFDAAAFDEGKSMSVGKSLTTRIGYMNRNGQVVVRNTRLPGTDENQYVYQLGCSECGHIYGANGSDIHDRLCPVHQGGVAALEYKSQ